MKKWYAVLLLWLMVSPSSAPAQSKWIWNRDSGWVDPLSLNPAIPDQHYKLALAMMVDRKYESAVKEFRAILKKHPDSDLAESCYQNIAQAYFLAGKYKKTFRTYESLLKRFPGTRLTGLIMAKEFQAGTALLELKPTASVEIFEKIIEHNPMGPIAPDCQVKIGDAYFQAQDYENAEDAYRKLLENYPKSEWAPYAQYHIPLAKLNTELRRERDLGKLLKAREGFEEYIANYPQGNFSQETKRHIHEIDETLAHREYHMAEFYLRQKNPKGAMVYLQRVTEKFPNTRWAEKAGEKIGFLKKINAIKK